ncbi:DUF4118 domain-containing protein [Phenylobacterium terrae]|uniref:histidine kinase n=1 Tax=Phenylobacterium terrae TaxID=2665495 RepID=A0ABW4N8P0_9CAUL
MPTASPANRWRSPTGRSRGVRTRAYLTTLAVMAAANLVTFTARNELSGTNVVMILLFAVLIPAVAYGLGPAILAALAATISYNFFYLEPRFTFWILHPVDVLTFVVFFAVAIATGWLAGRVRDQVRQTALRAEAASALLDASRDLSAAGTSAEAAKALSEHASRLSGSPAVVLLKEGEGLELAAAPDGLSRLGQEAFKAAERAWTGDGAGAAGWHFSPLEGLRGRVGVVGLRTSPAAAGDQETLLGALLHQGGIAIERAELMATAAENDALRRADQLRIALLNSVSHDFRTPLATVLGSATTLMEFEGTLKPAVRRDLLASIAENANRINRYVADLLDMGRLESGALAPRRELADVRSVIGRAIGRVEDRMGRRRIRRDFAKDLSRVAIDERLLEQVIVNLLENAMAYAPGESEIVVSAFEDPAHVVLSVDDQGPGICASDLPQIFDRFRRVPQASDRGKGLGLGLAIAKGFVEAMGGRIAAVSPILEAGGARFVISLPKTRATPGDLL